MEENLIEMVRISPFLYDRRIKLYKDFNAKEQKWQEISQKLNVPVLKVKKRWTTLRDRYKRQRKAPNSSQKKEWKFMMNLKFLDNVPDLNKRKNDQKIDDPVKEEICTDDDHVAPESNNCALLYEDFGDSVVDEIEENEESASESSSMQPKHLDHMNSPEILPFNNTAGVHKDILDFLTIAKNSITPTTTANSLFFSSIAMQIEEANLPFDIVSRIKLQVMNIVEKEIIQYTIHR